MYGQPRIRIGGNHGSRHGPNGSYPDAGTVSADILLERGGPQLPEGECIVTVLANGTDGIDNDSSIDAVDPNCQ